MLQHPKSNWKSSVNELLRESGGTAAMNVNGLVTPVEFFWEAVHGRFAFRVVNIHMISGTDPGVNEFGDIAALTNGLLFNHQDADGNVLYDFMDGVAITTNGHWMHLDADGLELYSSVGLGGIGAVGATWNLFESFGEPGHIIEKGHKIVVTVRDNLATITHYHTIIAGFYL